MNKQPLRRKDAYFGLHFDIHVNEKDTQLGADVTEGMIEWLLERVKPDYVQYDCQGVPGYAAYPSNVGMPSPGIVKDSLEIWRKVTRKYGVALLIHYCALMNALAVKEHPEWSAVNAEGKRSEGILSIFSPAVDKLVIPMLKEAIERYSLDGAWIDASSWASVSDYSPRALELFHQETGIEEIPKKCGDPYWHEFLAFNRRHVIAYMKHYIDAIHAFKPDFDITDNWCYSTFMPGPIEVNVDYLSGDNAAQPSPIEKSRLEARFLASRHMPWDLMAWGFTKTEAGTWGLRSAEDLMMEAAVVIAQGGGFQLYYNPTRSGYIPPWLIEIMGKVADFCHVRREVSFKTETVPQVMLLNSYESFIDKTDKLFQSWGGELNPVEGALHALLALHYSVDVATEHMLEPHVLEKYPVVVLPQCHVLTDGFKNALLEYVKNGGNLLLIGAETAKLFKDEIGAMFEGEAADLTVELMSGDQTITVNGLWQKIVPDTAQTIGYWYDTRDTRKFAQPAATINVLGKGRIAAVYGSLGEFYYKSHHPWIRDFLGDIMQQIFPQPMVELDAPPVVEMVLRRKGRRLLVHLINLSVMAVNARYMTADFIPSVGPIKMCIRLDKEPIDVANIPETNAIDWKWTEGKLELTLNRLDVHSVIAIDNRSTFEN